nr:MAG TPA: hypothetical protein [Bacteriophage sp.]
MYINIIIFYICNIMTTCKFTIPLIFHFSFTTNLNKIPKHIFNGYYSGTIIKINKSW